MTHLQERLKRLRSRTRQALWLHGASWIVVLLLGMGLSVGFTDWLFHLDNDRLRLSLGLLILGTAAILAWRVLIQPLRRTFSDVALALKIEQRFPGFQDSLASTVQFEQDGAHKPLGSHDLQNRVVEETLSQLDRVDLDDVIESRPVRRAVTFAVVVCLLLTVMIGMKPAEASLAFKRLVFPFAAEQEWPRQYELRLLTTELEPMSIDSGEPFRRVEGDNFKFYVDNRKGPLPHDATLQIRYGDGDWETEQLRRVTVRDKSGTVHHVCVANLVVERGPIRFRVIGGDDATMPMQTLNVVTPPQLKQWKVTLTPPTYSGRKPQTLPAGVGHFEALVGTRVQIEAVANKPLKSAVLRVKNDVIPGLKLSRDGLNISAKFIIRDSGNYSYWFELKDREKFGNPNAPRHDIRALTDRVPVVRLKSPTEDLRATPGAVIPVEYIAEDDIQIRSIALRFRRVVDPKARHESVSLYKRPAAKLPKPMSTAPRESRSVQGVYQWTIDAAVGSRLRFFVQADDDYDLSEKGLDHLGQTSAHVGRSVVRTVTIVSPTNKAAEIASRYGELLEDLARAERQQRQAQDLVGQLRVQIEKAGRLQPRADANLLRLVSRLQNEIAEQLVDERDGIQSRATQLLAELQANQIPDAKLSRRLNRIIGELNSLNVTAIQPIALKLRDSETALAATPAKAAAVSPKTTAAQRDRLNHVWEKQSEILDALRELIGQLAEWRNWHDLNGELKELIRGQQEIQSETTRLKSRTLGKPLEELPTQDQADLARLAERQRRLSTHLKQFQSSLEQFLAQLRKDPTSNRTPLEILTDAQGLIRDRGVILQMADAANQVDQNQLGGSVAGQKQILDALQELESILENRGTDDLETLIKRQKSAERELATLQKQQADLVERLQKLGKAPANEAERDELQRLVKRQNELRQKAAEIARNLRRLAANDSNNTLQRAAEAMEQTLESLRRNTLDQARFQQRSALDRIEQARRQLARTRQQNELTLARQVLKKLVDDLKGIGLRQSNVISGTTRLQTEYNRTRNWSRGRLISLDTLRDEQLRIQKRVAELTRSTQAAAVFAQALQNLEAPMREAAQLLNASRDEGNKLASALIAEKSAKRQLDRLIKTLTPETGPAGSQPKNNGGGNNANTNAELAGPSAIAQLKLLKSLQEEIQRETEEWNRERPVDGNLSAKQKRDLDRLAGRQEKLADLTTSLMRKFGITDDEPSEEKPNEKPTSADLLKRITKSMRSAASRLSKTETGTDTQKTQTEIIADLEQLIRDAPRTFQPQAVQNPQSPTRKTNTGKKSSPSNGNPKTKTNKKAPKTGDPGKTSSKKATKSENSVRQSPEAMKKQRTASRRRLVQEVWGHLPEAVRQQLRNVSEEKYLPKYKPLISRYFESLAE